MPRPSNDYTRINFYIDPRALHALKKLAARDNTTYSALVRTAVHDYVMSEKKRLEAAKTSAKS